MVMKTLYLRRDTIDLDDHVNMIGAHGLPQFRVHEVPYDRLEWVYVVASYLQ